MERRRPARQRNKTRQALIRSAAQRFPRVGFHRASLDDIAARVDLTIGAVYSSFPSKADLFLAVYAQRMDRWIAELQGAVAQAPTPPARLGAAVDFWSRYEKDERGWFLLYLEFWTFAARDRALLDRFLAQSRRLPHAIGELIGQGATELGVELRIPAEEAGLLVNALSNGALLEMVSDPGALTPELFTEAVRGLLASFISDASGTVSSRPRDHESQ